MINPQMPAQEKAISFCWYWAIKLQSKKLLLVLGQLSSQTTIHPDSIGLISDFLNYEVAELFKWRGYYDKDALLPLINLIDSFVKTQPERRINPERNINTGMCRWLFNQAYR